MDRSLFYRSDADSQKVGSYAWKAQKSDNGALVELLLQELHCALAAENWVLGVLPTVISSATSPAMRDIFSRHFEHTVEHISRNRFMFEILQERPQATQCSSIIKITEELNAALAATLPGTLDREAALLLAAQKMIHYEVATYTGLAALARDLGLHDIAAMLEANLAEEQQTHAQLRELAMTSVNEAAVFVC